MFLLLFLFSVRNIWRLRGFAFMGSHIMCSVFWGVKLENVHQPLITLSTTDAGFRLEGIQEMPPPNMLPWCSVPLRALRKGWIQTEAFSDRHECLLWGHRRGGGYHYSRTLSQAVTYSQSPFIFSKNHLLSPKLLTSSLLFPHKEGI